MNEWISVSDKLPDKAGNYLIFIPGEYNDNIMVARFGFNRKIPWRGVQPHSAIEDVTHWMPLPDKPNY